MAKRDPWTNMLRTTAACAAAAFGGADAITVLPYSWALGSRTVRPAHRSQYSDHAQEESRSAASSIQSAVPGTSKSSPTSRQGAWKLFQEIEAEGGMIGA